MWLSLPVLVNPNRSQQGDEERNVTWCWLRWVTTIYYDLAIVQVHVPT
jgi:hypothetical protein